MKPVKPHLFCLVLCLCLFGHLTPLSTAAEQDLWQALKQGDSFALIRHAMAPGTGDPPNFNIDNCATQRNLSENGRNQARNIGKRFRENGIHKAEVYSSRWCRCLETAALLDLGPVRELEILNSFFRRFENREKQTAALKSWIGEKEIRTPLILVTHQVNITAFTQIFPASGEMVVVRKDGQDKFAVLGTMAFEY